MEFGAVYGTHQQINIPVEIGTVLYNPESDEIDLSGKKFCYDLDVEQWANVTDPKGRTKGVRPRVFNLEKPDSPILYEKRFHLDDDGIRTAHGISEIIQKDLRGYLQNLLNQNIRTIVFFAKKRELDAFRRAKVDISTLIVHDLQKEIKNHYDLLDIKSLDRLSYLINFNLSNQTIRSENYSYTIPKKFLDLVKPHKAIGDAARMFLLSKEFYHHTDELREKIKPIMPLAKKSDPLKENQEFKDPQ
jgi:hypothetical protein